MSLLSFLLLMAFLKKKPRWRREFVFFFVSLLLVPVFLKKETFFTRMKEAFTGTGYKGEPNSIEGWAYKNSAFFMQQFVMLAQSKGWGKIGCGE